MIACIKVTLFPVSNASNKVITKVIFMSSFPFLEGAVIVVINKSGISKDHAASIAILIWSNK